MAAPLDLAAIYEAHALRIATWIRRLSGPGLDTDDIVHEVFLTVQKLLPEFRGEARLTTWLYRITLNVTRDWLRKQRRRARWLAEEPQADAIASPAETLESQQATQLVYQILDGLPERSRTVLILFEIEELSGEQIAEILNVKLNTVWSWLHRARSDFRTRLQKTRPAEYSCLATAKTKRLP